MAETVGVHRKQFFTGKSGLIYKMFRLNKCFRNVSPSLNVQVMRATGSD